MNGGSECISLRGFVEVFETRTEGCDQLTSKEDGSLRKFGWIIALSLIAGLVSRMPAKAQVGDSDLAQNWDLRIGFFVPERAGARAKGGDLWLNLGAEKTVVERERWRGTVSIFVRVLD